MQMLNRQSILIILLFSTSILRGQDYDSKSFGIGLIESVPLFAFSNSAAFESRTPGVHTTPNLFFSIQRHEIIVGPDIYSGQKVNNGYWTNKIYGFQMGYKYFLLKNDRKLNLFAECNLQYVQYGVGTTLSVQYNYLPSDRDHKDYNLIQNKSFINTFGIGIKRTFFKRLGLQFVLSGGYNYYKSNFSPTNTNHLRISGYYVGNKTVPFALAKLGISFKLWKEKPMLKP